MKDGRSSHPLYKARCDMRRRCYDTKFKNFHRWGGRGITVCDRWLEPGGVGFWNFAADIGLKPTPQHTLDREDTNGPYSPGNCRWATWHEQAVNTSANSGVAGVSYSNSKRLWRATLVVSGKMVLDMCSKDLDKAIVARRAAEVQYGV